MRIDHAEGVAILTCRSSGRVKIVCLGNGDQLAQLQLPSPFPLVEADQGWVVCTCGRTTIAVWRFESLGSGPEFRRGYMECMRSIECAAKPERLRLRFPYLAW